MAQGYIHQLSADEVDGSAVVLERLQRIEDQQALTLRMAQEEARWRKWSTIFTVAGALFAAARLGIIAVPAVRARRSATPAQAVEPVLNPRRRRRR